MSSTSKSNDKPPPKTMSQDASCLCQGVQFTVSGVDKGSVLCHCSNCRKYSGSAFMYNHRFLKAKVEFSRGEDLVTRYEDKATKSGKTLLRHFCRQCSSPLYMKPAEIKDMIIVPAGTADLDHQPQFDLFGENKHAWIGNLTAKKAKI